MTYDANTSLEMGFRASPVSNAFTHGPKTRSPFPTITSAFNYQVSSHPDFLAARDLSGASPREITYSELSRQAKNLAVRLLAAGVRPGDRVPLVVKRRIEMLVGILAILYCGAQYVPLDGGVVPESTLNFVLQQTGSELALCIRATEHVLRKTAKPCTPVVIEDSIEWADNEKSDLSAPDLATAASGCYVIYTSGTTGTPKGVDVTHKNVTNLVCLSPGNLGILPGTKVGSMLNISFDMGCLCNGGTLILRGSKWEDALREINVFICTPSILAKHDPETYPNIRVAATAGEPSSEKLADKWATNGIYYNCCGPTETTIVNTMHKHVPGTPLSIGRPTPNNAVYILDENQNPVSVGESGVMWAGGHGTTRGYIGLPEMTAQKYKLDRFANDGSMMYNTGDLCRWREDGLIDILGRQDDQVKFKGFRIELDGVTASIESFPSVNRACALLIENEIHGFYSPASIDVEALKTHMKTKQPYYAIPTRFHPLNSLPSTPNGKIDKRALKSIVSFSRNSTPPGSTISIPSTLLASYPPSSALSSAPSITDIKAAAQEEWNINADLPDKDLPQPIRGLVYRVFIVYRRLFTLAGLLNLAALISVFVLGINREWLNTLVAINLVLAVLIRQDFVINLLYTICCSVPRSWPLAIRRRCALVYHLGGVHSGAAFCAGAWLIVSNVSNVVCSLVDDAVCPNFTPQSVASQVISWMLTALFMVMFAMAWPSVRKNHHDLFERTHRFVGWTMLGLFWVQVFLGAEDYRRAHNPTQSLATAAAFTPGVWLLVVATLSIATSWAFLRKVPVDAEVLSDHAVRLHFDYAVPVNGSFTRLSTRPLVEWHSFAVIPAPHAVNGRPKGHSLVVSNAGDWTRHVIQNPPTSIWVRGVPTCGVMHVATLFNNVVIVATGSGIGPCLGHIQNSSCKRSVIWSTPRPEHTFGQAMIDSILKKVPDAVIHDTRKLGRPDLLKMSYNMAKEKGAEAVIIISNEKITKKVVYGLETRGVAAYGAIWDS